MSDADQQATVEACRLAWYAGRQAAQEDAPGGANPHPSGTQEAAAWDDGWCSWFEEMDRED